MRVKYRLLIVSLFFFGCAPALLDQAFRGKLTPEENNKVINEYCQSCHVHSKISPDLHVKTISQKYQEERYKNAKECNVCHSLEERLFSDPKRLTRRP